MSSAWPKHPDGKPKKMGEMTRDEQRAQWRSAATRLEAEFADPLVQEKIAAVLSGANVKH